MMLHGVPALTFLGAEGKALFNNKSVATFLRLMIVYPESGFKFMIPVH